MDVEVQIGLLLALATAFGSILGFLYKQRGAMAAPAVDWRRPLHSSIALFSSRLYVLGCVIATSSWGLHVAALALAPISLVQTVIAAGLVFLTVAADRLFGFTVTRREWIGVAMAAVGLAVLAATIEYGEDARSAYGLGALVTFEVTVIGLSLAAALIRRGVGAPGIALAASAGLMWGGSDVAIKALSDEFDRGLIVLVDPLALLILVLSLVALLVSASSLQTGAAVPVIATTSVTANVSTILAGPIVFGEPVPADAVGVAVRVMAFTLVIAAAALTPGPLRPAT